MAQRPLENNSYKGVTDRLLIRELINLTKTLHGMNVNDLPFVYLVNKKLLPPASGVYLLFDSTSIYYIGQATNLLDRWKGHEILAKFDFDQNPTLKNNLKIAFLVVSPPFLDYLEIYLIENLHPLFNVQHNLSKPEKQVEVKEIREVPYLNRLKKLYP